METGLRAKRALITGGARGIGFSIAKALAAEGVHVAIVDRDPDSDGLAALARSGVQVESIVADVSSEPAAVGMVHEAITRLHGLDLLVNNAAVAKHEPVTKITAEALQETMNTNLAACLWACREAAKHMIAHRTGSILIVGSTVQFCPAYGETAYRISKMGLKMLMETLAIELAPHGIRVNMLTPGACETRLFAGIAEDRRARLRDEIPLRRFGNSDEVAATALLLMSDQLSPYTTGADMVVDGGLSLRPLPMPSQRDIFLLNAE